MLPRFLEKQKGSSSENNTLFLSLPVNPMEFAIYTIFHKAEDLT